MTDRIERLEAIEAYADPRNKWIRVYFDRVRLPDGTEGRYNRVVEGSGAPGVVVMPTDGKKVGLVRVFRYPINSFSIEFPRGFGEGGDPADDAERELREETGWRSTRLTPLGVVHANTGILSGAVRLYAAHVTSWSPAGPRDGEALDCLVWDVAEVAAAVADGRITDALTLACFLRAREGGIFHI